MNKTRNILITGGNSSLGKALIDIAMRLDNRRILISTYRNCDIIESDLSDNTELIRNIDLTEEENLKTLQSKCMDYFEGPFEIIHSVGNFWNHVPFEDYKLKDARDMIESHYITLYGVSQYLIPLMIKNGGGFITAFSCNSVNYNYPYMAAFTAAKAAVESLVKCLANEYARYNIVANAIELSSIQTEQVRASKPYGDFNNFMNPNDIAELALRVNTEAFKYMNGNIIELFKYSDSFFGEGYFQRNKNN